MKNILNQFAKASEVLKNKIKPATTIIKTKTDDEVNKNQKDEMKLKQSMDDNKIQKQQTLPQKKLYLVSKWQYLSQKAKKFKSQIQVPNIDISGKIKELKINETIQSANQTLKNSIPDKQDVNKKLNEVRQSATSTISENSDKLVKRINSLKDQIKVPQINVSSTIKNSKIRETLSKTKEKVSESIPNSQEVTNKLCDISSSTKEYLGRGTKKLSFFQSYSTNYMAKLYRKIWLSFAALFIIGLFVYGIGTQIPKQIRLYLTQSSKKQNDNKPNVINQC